MDLNMKRNEIIQRQSYDDGIDSKRFKDSGVEQLFIAGIVDNADKNFENIQNK